MDYVLGYEEFKVLSIETKQKLCNHLYYSSRSCRAHKEFCNGRIRFVVGQPHSDEWCSHWRDIDPFVILMVLRKEKRMHDIR